MTASTPLEVHTEKSACGYTVQEPSEHGDADSQLSPSVDTDTPATRYTMAEMEAYMQLVRNDREQVQQEVQNLQAGFDCLFHAMKKPAEEIEEILEDQTKTTAMVEEIEKFKQEVSKSLTMLTVKCDMLDKHVPELKEKLEYAIHTISVAQQSIDAANLNSPAPSERSTSIGDFRFAGVSVEEIRQLHERSKREGNQMKKDYQDFKSGMMELQAIRARLNEGIERNGISDLKELNRVSTTKELRDQLQAHERRQSDGRHRDVTCSLDLLAQYLREAVDRARFGSASPELLDAAPKLIRTQSPDVAQKGKGAKLRDPVNGATKPVRSRTPKSHQVRLSCEETSPARSLSRGSSNSSRARSLDYARNNGTGIGTNRPGTARTTRPLPRYEARSRIDTGRNTSNTPTRNSVGGTARSSFGTRRHGLGGSMGASDASPHSEASMRPAAVSASPSRSTTSLAPPSRAAAMSKASINRLSQPKAGARRGVRSSNDSFKGDLSASTKSAIPRQSADRGRSASAKRPNSRGGQPVRTSSQASTTCLSQDHATTDDMAESSMCDSMASGMEDTASMPLTMVPASATATGAEFANLVDGGDQGSATGADAELGSSLLQGMPMLDTLDRHSPSASNEQSLSSAHSVPNPYLVSPGDKRRDNNGNGIPPLADGLPALVTTLDSPDVTSARSPGAQKVRSMRQAYSESQDRSLRQVAESIDHGREPAAPFQEPPDTELEPITASTSQLESLHLDLDGVRDTARSSDDADQSENPVRSVRTWLHSGSDVGSEGDVAGSITGSVIGSGLPNGLPGGISPRGLLSGMGQSVNSPMRRSPHKSSPHTSSPSPRHPLPSPRTWDVDQALNAASLVPGDSHVEHGRDAGDDATKSNYASIPAPGSADRRQSLSRLAPVVEEPGASASVDASSDILGSWRNASTRPMQSSAEWLHRQASLKENNNGNMGHPSPSKQSKMRSFNTDNASLDLHARNFQTRGYSDYNHDAFSIDSKDSCKPEKCESPAKPQRHSVQRNGQGTDPPKYQNSQLEQRIAQLVNRK